ncbi:MAG: HD domain-containing phosphohydrolase [Gemmatimonadales bacterium]
MTVSGVVLVVDDEPTALRPIVELLSRHRGLTVLEATSGEAALGIARARHPDLVISDLRMPGLDGLDLCRAIRTDERLEGTMFVILTGVQEASQELLGKWEIDDLLVKPVTEVELIGKVHAMLRLRRLHEQLRTDKAELERLNQAAVDRLSQLLDLLAHLVDLRVPGAAERGAENARLAAALADHFEVPVGLRRDLEVAIRLHEIGKVVLQSETATEGPEDILEGDDWRYVVAARELLERTEGLMPAAELIGAAFENWDGTGHPDRLRQGQIPLRSRILRVLIEYQRLRERPATASPEAALAALQTHSGTRYDPLVIAYLEGALRADAGEATRPTRVRVGVGQLEPGMVLAEDLCTSSGMKMLAAGAVLGEGTIETIRRRHQSDPIVHGVWVDRSASPDGSPRGG